MNAITFDNLPSRISQSNVIRLHQDAGERVREWQRKTFLPASVIVSHIIMSANVETPSRNNVFVTEDAYAALCEYERKSGYTATEILSKIIMDTIAKEDA